MGFPSSAPGRGGGVVYGCGGGFSFYGTSGKCSVLLEDRGRMSEAKYSGPNNLILLNSSAIQFNLANSI